MHDLTFESKMHRNGMVVIPADIVRQMGLKKGSFVLCFFHVENQWIKGFFLARMLDSNRVSIPHAYKLQMRSLSVPIEELTLHFRVTTEFPDEILPLVTV